MSEKSNKHLDLTQGKISTQIIRFIWPVFLASVFQQIYNLTNQMLVGNFVSTAALSAVSASSVITGVFTQMFNGIGLAGGILVSNNFGAKNYEKLKDVAHTALIVALVGGIIITGISELAIPLMMKVTNMNAEIYPIALGYLRVYVLGSMAVLMYNMCFHMMRSLGDTRHPLYYLILSSVINLVLGLLFVRVFNWSVIGTALATIISQFTVDIMCLRLMMKNELLQVNFRDFSVNWNVVREICSLGITTGVQNALVGLSGVVTQSYINLFSTEIIAGLGVAQRVSNYAALPLHSLTTVSTSYIGQNYGAKKYDRVRDGIKYCLTLSNIISLITCTTVFIFAKPLVGMFNRNPDVIKYGSEMVRWTVYSNIFIGWSHIYNGTCRGAGNVKFPLFIAVFSHFVVRFLFVTIAFKISFDVHNIYMTSVIGAVCAGTLAFLYFRFGKWTKEHHLRV